MSRDAGRALEAPPERERDLLSSVCHDLKAPLASITMGVAYLRRVLPGDDVAISNVVEALHRSTQRMTRTVGSFADLAKLQAGEIDLDLRPVALSELMVAVHGALAAEARADRVPLEVDVAPEVAAVPLPCDRARFEQVASQLFACAVRVLPSGGNVTLRVRQAPHAVRFDMEARPAQDAPGRPLRRDLPKPEFAIAKGLVELHGGRLEIGGDERSLCLSFAMPLSPPSHPSPKGRGDAR